MILALLHTSIIISLIWAFRPRHTFALPQKWYWIGLMLRFIACFLVSSYYIFYVESGDTLHFFEEAKKLTFLWADSPKGYLNYLVEQQHPLKMAANRNGFFIKIVSVFCLVTNNNYWITASYFALFSFFAGWRLVLAFAKNQIKIPAIIAFLLLPSPIFWSSGLLKDTLINASIYLLASLLINKKWNVISISVLLLSSWLIFRLRYFVFGAVLLTIFIHFFAPYFKKQFQRHQLFTVIISILIFTISIFTITKINPNLRFERFPKVIYGDYTFVQSQSASGEALKFSTLSDTWISLLVTIPQSLFAGLYRPFIWECPPLQLIHGVETLILLLGSIYLIYHRKFLKGTKTKIISPLFFIIIMATFLPLANANFGSLVRYKAVYLPWLYLLISQGIILVIVEKIDEKSNFAARLIKKWINQ